MDARDELLSLSRWFYERWPSVPQYFQRPAAEAPRPSLHLSTVYTENRPLTGAYYDDAYTHQVHYRAPEGSSAFHPHAFLDDVAHALLDSTTIHGVIPGYLHDFVWARPAVVLASGGLPAGEHFFRVAGINALGQETLPSRPLRVVLAETGGIQLYPARFPPGNPLAVRHAVYYSEQASGPYRLITEVPDARLRARPSLIVTGVPGPGRAPLEPGAEDRPASVVFWRTIRIEGVDKDVIEDDEIPGLLTGFLRLRTCSLAVRMPESTVPVMVAETPVTPPGGGDPPGGNPPGGDNPPGGNPPIGDIHTILLDP